MKKFLKKHYPKFICAITLVLLISASVITSFAYFPSNGVSFQYDDLKSTFYADEYYYRYIIEAYNWNVNTTDGRIPMEGNFNNYYKFAWFPFRSTDTIDIKTYIKSTLIQLASSVNNSYFTNIISYVNDYEIIVYYDIVYNQTKIVFIPTEANNLNYTIYNANFVCYTSNGNGVDLDGNNKKFCTLNATGKTIGGLSKSPDAFIFSINNNGNSFSYTNSNLSGTSILFAPQNILFCTSKVRQAILNKYNNDSNIFVNYYNINGLNSIQFIDFNNIVNDFSIDMSASTRDFMIGKIKNFEGAEFTITLNFDVYMYGTTNIDFNRFFTSMQFLRNIYGERTINIITTYSTTWNAFNYKVISNRAYRNEYNSADLNVYTIQVELTTTTSNNEFIQNLNGYNQFDVVYFESLEWSTSLPNNKTYFGYDLSFNQNTDQLTTLWTTLQGGIDFITYITSRLYIILPAQIYTFLTVSLTIVIILGSIRLIIK